MDDFFTKLGEEIAQRMRKELGVSPETNPPVKCKPRICSDCPLRTRHWYFVEAKKVRCEVCKGILSDNHDELLGANICPKEACAETLERLLGLAEEIDDKAYMRYSTVLRAETGKLWCFQLERYKIPKTAGRAVLTVLEWVLRRRMTMSHPVIRTFEEWMRFNDYDCNY